MPLFLVDDIAKYGIIQDTPARKLPDGAWSDGRNVRFDDSTASKVKGSRAITGSLSTSAYSLFSHTTFDGAHFIAYAGLTSVFTTNNNVHYDITRVAASGTAVAYSTDATELWTGGVFGGLLFMNNTIDVPQIQRTPTASCRLSDLPNWPATVTTRAACLRAFRNFLIALDITKGTQRFRQMVKWSSSADPLTVPATWDEADTTNDAGEFSLADTDGTCIDCLPLRDVNIIYKDDSIWGQQFIGGTFIFRFYQIFNSVGLLARRCVTSFEHYHFFIGNDLDMYVHDGNTIRSVADMRWKKWLKNNMDASNFQRAFCATNLTTSEVWIFVPTGDAAYTSKILMWNWKTDTWGIRDAHNLSSATLGIIETSDYVILWNAITETWDTIASTWSEVAALPPEKRMVVSDPDTMTGLIEVEFGSMELGSNLPFMLERKNMWAYTCKVQDGARVIDLQSKKFVSRIRVRTVASSEAVQGSTTGFSLNFMVSVEDDINPPTYITTAGNIGETTDIPVYARGRFLSLRIECTEDELFDVISFEAVVDRSGEY